jgi:ADA HAT complex component 1
MQSMFRLPWSSEPACDKIMDKAAFHKPRPIPVVEIPFMKNLKRKRTDSPEPASSHHAHVVKKWRDAHGEVKPAVTDQGVVERVTVVDGVVRATQLPKESAVPSATPVIASPSESCSKPDVPHLRKEAAAKPNPPKTTTAQAPVAIATTFNASDAIADNTMDTTSENAPTSSKANRLTRQKQVAEAEINLEILMKHNELRCIEQELAKCQIALEQVRRCQLIPFPGSQGPSQEVSSGVGPALRPTPGYTEPQYAAPWGVTDGPYTRHYAKWLIPDPKFDSMSERALAQSQGYFGLAEGRLTRGSFAELPTTGKPRTSRTSTGAFGLRALGENPAPAPKIDPLLHKRSTDGQWVRLFCAQCNHGSFSNTQGFLNHCRIKHNQIFKSHDAAAIACGVPVDVNESGVPVPASEPPSATVATTPAVTFPAPMTPGFVHPLIKTNPTEMARNVHRDFSMDRAHDEGLSNTMATPFESSPTTPALSNLLQKRGFTENLKQLVQDVRRPLPSPENLEASDDDMVDSAIQTPIAPHSKATSSPQLARHPVSAPNAVAPEQTPMRAGSKRKHSDNLPPLFPVKGRCQNHGNGGKVHLPDSPLELSPHTVESNPGLVSDHDDDDDEDADDARSEPRMEHGENYPMSDNVLVEDASDVEGPDVCAGSRKGFGGFEKAEASKKN